MIHARKGPEESVRRTAPPETPMGLGGLVAGLILILLGVPAVGAERVPVAAAVHVHTSFSTGSEDLDALVREARTGGLQAVLFTENYSLAFEYGVRPLAGIARWRERFPSLTPGDLPAYLEAVRRARERYPDMILLPGFEVIPYYYWVGSLRHGNLTMRDGQKNLLLFGLERAGAVQALPLVGNKRRLRAGDWFGRLAPLVMLAPGVWLFRRRAVRRIRLQRFRIRREVRYRWAGVPLMAMALLLTLNDFKAGSPYWDPQEGPRGYVPHQATIDAVTALGGVSVWSLPEAVDLSVHRRAGFSVTIRTDPYPDALAQTRGFTAFGALYADTTSVERPGGLWDRLLLEHVTGRRRTWPVAIGETAFHVRGEAGKTLNDVQTVFLVAVRTPAGLLEALREGRAYAHLRAQQFALVLEGFTVNGAGLGETAAAAPGTPSRIALALAASDGEAHAAEVRLIRNGTVLQAWKGTTPLTLNMEDGHPPPTTAWYYRVEARGERGTRLLTNPIFVGVRG